VTPRPRILVAGATGYIGRRLVAELVDHGENVVCLARSPEKLALEPWRARVDVVRGDVLDRASLDAAFAGVDVAYFLVHSMLGGRDFDERDRRAAEHFRDAAAAAGARQIVYLGGLGDSAADDGLSRHLRSRHDVGRVLASGSVPVTELRAAVIIGAGSASFEMLRHLVEVLPAMVTPRWVGTRCQPIAIRDVLAYLRSVLDEPRAFGRVFEIGGADVLTYREMMQVYAEAAGLRRRVVVPVPVLSPRLSSLWIGLVTPLPPSLARPLIDSLTIEVVVRDDSIREIDPHEPIGYREAVALALRRVEDLDVRTSWSDAELAGRSPADPMPTDPDWSGGVVLADEQHAHVDESPAATFASVASLGGDTGWLAGNWMWEVRGLLDRMVGGIGTRRGRRHPTQLRVGDAVDFWRVEALEPDRLLRLRAEMRLPGEAWLEWRLSPAPGGGTHVVQRARFHPRGLWGRCYWLAMLPFHRFIFGPLLRRIGERAVAAGSGRQRDDLVRAQHPA
jgi:uncharacterized protein YbjT (DUF2867 family)